MSDGVSLGYGKCIHHTTSLSNKSTGTGEGALRIKLEEEDKLIWVPKSVIHDNTEVYDLNHEGDVMVDQWWAEDKGFI